MASSRPTSSWTAPGEAPVSALPVKPVPGSDPSNREMKPPRAERDPLGLAADEARQVERARAGDVDAFGALVVAHTGRAYGLALRIVRSAPDAEEVVQDAFVRAWNALPGFRGEAAFGTWLHRIVVRRALDRRERLQARAVREGPLDAGIAAPQRDAAQSPADRVRIERYLAGLPDVQRAVVTLYYLHDRSIADVASVLGLNENTTKTHLHRARAALRRAWDTEHGT